MDYAAPRSTRTSQGDASRARCLTILTLCLALIPSFELHAGGRRRAVPVSSPADELMITFVDAPGGTLDAGALGGINTVADRKGSRAAITRKTFGLRIGRPSREANGSATLRAFLETADPRCIVRLDGIVLSTQPRIVDRFTPIGVITTHRLEIEVPVSASEGALVLSIGWDVTTD